MVHLEAGRYKLVGLPKDQCPSALAALKRDWYLALPLAALVYMLFTGFTPLFAGTVGLALTIILILGSALVSPLGTAMLRGGFWIALGLVGGAIIASDRYSINTVLFAIILLLSAACLFSPSPRGTVRMLIMSLAEGAKSALGVGVACALVGIIVGIATLTGLAGELARIVLDLAGNHLFLALVMTMIVSLILGTGVPTIPNYIITSAMAAPALLQLGVPLIISHMFVFYFGIMADLTPPVALAALAASSITKTSYVEIGFIATRIAIAGYVVPFMAVYDPSLMLQGHWTLASVAYVVFKALFSIMLWGGAATGYLFGPMSWPERILATAAAFLVVIAIPWTDEAGFALGVTFLFYHRWRCRRAIAAAA
jgi:TRAP transporter 4TM/12TM fusion protein